MTDPTDRYLGAVEVPVSDEGTLDGAPMLARVHFGSIGGRAHCVGLELLGFRTEVVDDGDGPVQWHTPYPAWLPLTSRRLRTLRLDALVERGRKELLAGFEGAQRSMQGRADDWFDQLATEYVDQASAALGGPIRAPRPGRPPVLSDEDLVNVVARAYAEHVRSGGRKPVKAVQEALAASDSAVVNTDGSVSINQARAAVRRARAANLLPALQARGGEE